jgi:beta-lactam-binding protein with PASTA domain
MEQLGSPQPSRNKYIEKIKAFAQEVWWFVSSGIFLKNCASILVFLTAFLWMTTYWLKCYTDHGESLSVPDFVGMTLEEAEKKVKSRGFTLVASDSIDKPGAVPFTIIEQNPKSGARVKEDRTIYLTITKAVMSNVPLPDIAGGNDDFEQYQKKLQLQDIRAEILGRKYDPILEPNTIVDVIYEGDTITNKLRYGVKVPKGSVVYFVVSERENSNIQIPDLVCQKVEAAKFLLVSHNLMLGNLVKDNSVLNEEEAYVWKQEPAFAPNTTIRIGEQITIYVTGKVPSGCTTTEE